METDVERIAAELRAKGATEERIERISRAIARNVQRRASEGALVVALRAQWIMHVIVAGDEQGWTVRERAADGVLLDHRRGGRRVMFSVAQEDDGEVWLHGSISRRDRVLPTYSDLKALHHTFMSSLVALQLFVPAAEHVDDREVLHLFACLSKRVTPDFTGGTGSI